MTNRVRIKRSAVPGKVPTTADLELGELAINTFDGRAFTKKDDGTASVVGIGTVTSVSGLGPISVASGTTTPVISLNTTGVASGVYGGSTQVAVVTVDQYGRITAISGVAITAGAGASIGVAVALG
jgi:hypothetical protein